MQTNLIWVQELMHEGGRKWNRKLVENIFTDKDANAILNIEGLDPTQKYRLTWEWTADGNFSVSSSYAKRAEIIWKLSPITWEGIRAYKDNFKQWWTKACSVNNSPTSERRLQLSSYILWWMWKTRNL
ncbi:30S ribosomal protein S2 [Striga asiatica]|uniref:30S ribosomal protein S2 n=1 Tax=Striga asiatica TaxID=4170 RepID=A0A5A7QHX3_STRAF|nr:30S ribosomal protein S2 [Striga asiatica]